MAKKSDADKELLVNDQPPAITQEAREKQVIAMAYDLAEKQIREGTASSQVITHFLKIGSQRERLERARLEEENRLLRAKTEKLESDSKLEALYAEALQAMKEYAGDDTKDIL